MEEKAARRTSGALFWSAKTEPEIDSSGGEVSHRKCIVEQDLPSQSSVPLSGRFPLSLPCTSKIFHSFAAAILGDHAV
jgi:hypothetical protein